MWGKTVWSSGRSLNAVSSPSTSPRIRDTSDFAIPVSAPNALTRSSTERGRDPVHVCRHHHGEQGPVDPPTPLQQRGEERPGPHLGDLQVQVDGLGGQQPVTVPLRQVVRRSECSPKGGTDDLDRLGLNELLQNAARTAP